MPWLYITCPEHPSNTTVTRVYQKKLEVECGVKGCDKVLGRFTLEESVPETEDKPLIKN